MPSLKKISINVKSEGKKIGLNFVLTPQLMRKIEEACSSMYLPCLLVCKL
jgi:hypothetical protein